MRDDSCAEFAVIHVYVEHVGARGVFLLCLAEFWRYSAQFLMSDGLNIII